MELLQDAVASGCTEPIILLTGQGDHNVDVAAMEMGAVDYLAKDRIDKELLERSIRYAIERAQTLRALRDAEARNQALLDGVPDLILRLSRDATLLDFRASEEQTVPYLGAGEVLGRTIAEVLPIEIAEQAMHHIEQAFTLGEVQVFEHQLPMKDELRDFEARIIPVEGSNEVVILVRDISDRKAAERHLEELVRSKDEFLASVSHELRTPLTAVVGFAEVLQDSGESLGVAEQEAMINSIAREALDIANIVEDLLVVARAEIGELTVVRVPVDVGAEVANVLEARSQAVATVEVVEETEERLECRGDAARLRQILRNLIDNAGRHGGEHIQVHITGSDGVVRLLVRDDGPGLPVKQWERIFEPYSRAYPPDGLPASLGIGLTVSRQLARLMDGDLTYHYDGAWSIFELTLPST